MIGLETSWSKIFSAWLFVPVLALAACRSHLPVLVEDDQSMRGCTEPACNATVTQATSPAMVAAPAADAGIPDRARQSGGSGAGESMMPLAGAPAINSLTGAGVGDDAAVGVAGGSGAGPSSGVGGHAAPMSTKPPVAPPINSDAGARPLEQGEACTSDSECSSGYCNGRCTVPQPNGSACLRDRDCTSSHCNAGLCCASGDCCSKAESCPARYTQIAACSNQSTCQGTRGDPTCVDWRCGSQRVDDDSACRETTVASDCEAFLDLHCTGAANQPRVACPATCSSSSECDLGAFCDHGVCARKKPSGESCGKPGESSDECETAFCGSNGLCCGFLDGSCCKDVSDCVGAQFKWENCHVPTCEGTRSEPACVSGLCVDNDPIPYPQACSGITHACLSSADTERERLCPDACHCKATADCQVEGQVCRGGLCVLR